MFCHTLLFFHLLICFSFDMLFFLFIRTNTFFYICNWPVTGPIERDTSTVVRLVFSVCCTSRNSDAEMIYYA